MIVVLKEHPNEKQLDNLKAWLTSLGLRIHESEGVNHQILGLVGDTSRVDIDLIQALDIVEDVKRIQEPYKNANRKFHPLDTVITAGNTKIGGGNFAVIAGPCSVESEEQIISVGEIREQLVGDIVHVYMRDSVIDHAHIVGNAFSIQQLKTDTACYNQLSSKEMFAYFIDGEIHEGRAKDNVLIGYFFEEGDSVPIIYNYQETSELRMFFKNRKVDRVWTPKTTGTMYPLNQIPADRRRLYRMDGSVRCGTALSARKIPFAYTNDPGGKGRR